MHKFISLCGYAVSLLAFLAFSVEVQAVNRVGDANADGAVDSADAPLVQGRIYGLIDSWSIGPLALADSDGDLDLADLLLVAQAANGARTIQGPGSLFVYTSMTNQSLVSGDPPYSILWGVYSNYVGVAENSDGIQTGVTVLPPGAESYVSDAAPTVASLSAQTDFIPINTSGATQIVTVRLNVGLADSDGALLETDYQYLTFSVAPSVCGNGWVQPGEACDDPALCGLPAECECDCSGTVPPSVCGNGTTEWGEGCDDGNTDDCVGPCLGDCSGSAYVCGDGNLHCAEACDDGNADDCVGPCQGNCSGPAYVCGDGVKHCAEACDDGNTDDCVGPCLGDCSGLAYVCGDGVQHCAEACDDGNADDCIGDCLGNCSGPAYVCGDGIQQCAELCDDGALNGARNGCDLSCQDHCSPKPHCQVLIPGVFTDQGAVALDSVGNMYIGGQFEGTINLGGGDLTSIGANDIYMAKFDPDCNYLWSQGFGSSAEEFLWDIDVAPNDDPIITGYLESGPVDFGGGPLTQSRGAFLAKFDATGAHIWSYAYDASISGWAAFQQNRHEVLVSPSGEIYLALMGAPADFGCGPGSLVGSEDLVIAKLDSAGSCLWSENFGAEPFASLYPKSKPDIALDANGDLFVFGSYAGLTSFGGPTLSTSASGECYLAKFDSNGNHLWSIDTAGTPSSDCWAYDLTLDSQGQPYVAGRFYWETDFGGGIRFSEYESGFLAHYDANGNYLKDWTFGTPNLFGFGKALGTDGLGNAVFLGNSWTTVDLGGSYTLPFGEFIASLDDTGSQQYLSNIPFVDTDHFYDMDARDRWLAFHGIGGVNTDFGLGPFGSSGAFLVKFAPDPSSDCYQCGNNVTDPGETCDDGNLVNGDGCNSFCSGP